MASDKQTEQMEKLKAAEAADAAEERAVDENLTIQTDAPGDLGMMQTSQLDIRVKKRDETGQEISVADSISQEALNNARNAGNAVFNKEIEILPGKPLPHLDKGSTKAYAAQIVGLANEDMFAMVCDKHVPPRTFSLQPYSTTMNITLVPLVAAGVVYWPPEREQRYVLIFENTLGQPLLTNINKPGLGLKYDKIHTAVVKPMVYLLMDLRDANLYHGQIRPQNMYDGGHGELERALLGECLSVPPGYSQDALFEPIERAMTDPLARGLGTIQDDVYSLGVSIIYLMRTRNPMEGLSDKEIINEKIEHGSYGALTGKERYSGPVLELLRGVLNDDPRARWSIDDILTWFEGQRLSPKQAGTVRKKKAARPLDFKGHKYFRAAPLAVDMGENIEEATALIESKAISNWAQRSLEDAMTSARVTDAINASYEAGKGADFNQQLVSRVSMALDPDAPIRFKGISIHPEGYQYALAHTMSSGGEVGPYVDIVRNKFINYWVGLQSEDALLDLTTIASRFENAQAFLLQQTGGYGLERCLYYLCKEAPCLSDKVGGYYIRTPDDLMYAFEEISERKDRPDMFIDRHISAFLSAKDKKVIDAYLMEVNASERHYRIIGNIKTIAMIQQVSKMPNFPGIAGWMSDLLPDVYERLHDRDLRADMAKRVDKFKEKGELTKIAGLLAAKDIFKRDYNNFKAAMREYAELCNEQEKLERRLEKPEVFGLDLARDVASVVSGILAAIVMIGLIIVYFTQGTVL